MLMMRISASLIDSCSLSVNIFTVFFVFLWMGSTENVWIFHFFSLISFRAFITTFNSSSIIRYFIMKKEDVFSMDNNKIYQIYKKWLRKMKNSSFSVTYLRLKGKSWSDRTMKEQTNFTSWIRDMKLGNGIKN